MADLENQDEYGDDKDFQSFKKMYHQFHKDNHKEYVKHTNMLT